MKSEHLLRAFVVVLAGETSRKSNLPSTLPLNLSMISSHNLHCTVGKRRRNIILTIRQEVAKSIPARKIDKNAIRSGRPREAQDAYAFTEARIRFPELLPTPTDVFMRFYEKEKRSKQQTRLLSYNYCLVIQDYNDGIRKTTSRI